MLSAPPGSAQKFGDSLSSLEQLKMMQGGASARAYQVRDLYDKAIAHAERGVGRSHVCPLLICHTYARE